MSALRKAGPQRGTAGGRSRDSRPVRHQAEHRLPLRPLNRAVLLAAALTALACRATAADRYNVLLVSLDSVRQDFVGCYGHRPRRAPDVPTTPEIDRLAALGARMEDAYASSSWTLPSHVSLLTGEPEVVHGVDTDQQTLDASVPTLAEILKYHGYRTAGVFSGPYLEPHWGFGRGFDRYRAAYGRKVAAASRLAERLRAQGPSPGSRLSAFRVYEKVKNLSHRDVNSSEVTAATLAELDDLRATGEPWFLFVHYFDAHYDYVPPPPYDARFDPDYRGTITAEDFLANPRISVPDPATPDGFIRRVSDRDLDHLIALYEGEIAWVDAHVGEVVRRLDALDLARRTLVIVVSDHGDEFFEHGGLGHHRTLYEEVVKVPLVLRLPGVLPAGAAVPGPVALSDVVPTVLDVLGIDAPPGLTSTSFLALIRGGARDGTAIARLVTQHTGRVTIDGTTVVPATQVTVQEAFRREAIKLTRARTWPEFPPDLPARSAAILRPETEAQHAREQLSWIDVARYPGEPDDARSSEFADPRARAALESVRGLYRRLLLPRRTPGTARPGEAVRRALDGLGYVDTGAGAALPASRFALPPPGDGR